MKRQQLSCAFELERVPHPAEQQAGPSARPVVARFMSSNFSRSGIAGFRGASPEPVRQFILRDDEYDIHIKMWGDVDRRQIRGQLLPRSGKGFAPPANCHLLRYGVRIQSTLTDETGEFQFDDVPQGELYLQIDLTGLTIVGSLDFPN